MTNPQPGKIYVVATPIGNLEDISARALRILDDVDLIAAEDTRHTAKLCRHFGIEARFLSMHGFNETERVASLLNRVKNGETVAIVSDAGTPLVSDPGYAMVKAAREQGVEVSPVPGVSAFVAALSVAGLPSHRFAFEGFLPAKRAGRMARLEELAEDSRTLIFYESPHRILDMIEDIRAIFTGRRIVVARELTKTFETILSGTAEELLDLMRTDANQVRGEFVVLLEGNPGAARGKAELDTDRLLLALSEELPTKKAASIAARVTGMAKKELYNRVLELKGDK